MKLPQVLDTKAAGYAVLALLGAAAVYWLAKKAWSGVQSSALNPASSDNLVNQGVESFGQSLTGDPYWTLGGWLYDSTHSDPMGDPANAWDWTDWYNPASEYNVINNTVQRAGQAASGDQYWTLGGWFYDLTHDPYDPNAPLQAETTRKAQVQASSALNLDWLFAPHG